MRDIELLHPTLREKAKQLQNMCTQNELPFLITETWRTPAEQDELYAQGRTKPGNIVTNAKGSSFQSGHQWGVAFDFCRNVKGKEYDDSDGFFKKVGTLGKSIGLAWGGDWKSPDKPHLEWPEFMPNNSTAALIGKYGTPDKFMAAWPGNNTPTLRLGDKGDAVKRLQTLLNQAGATLVTDGSFGSLTEAALKKYQQSKKLAADGICGPKTWDALLNTPSAPNQDKLAQVVAYAVELITANEGDYGTINKNDNGAVSIGKMQWHAGRALSLLKTIIDKNPPQARSILKIALYSEINNVKSNAWDKTGNPPTGRIVNDEEAKHIAALLTIADGKAAQDALAITDITGYVVKGMNYGLTDIGALLYFADGVNQYGTESARWKSIAENALKTTGDVLAMFNATAAAVDNLYMERRKRVYNVIIALGFGKTATFITPGKTPEEITVENAVAAGLITDTVHWLGVLTGKIVPTPSFIKIILDNACKKINKS